MSQPKITLYVDVVSPFAYEAFHILQSDPSFKDVQITYIPIFLGGLMKACGNTAPIYVKNKDKWIQVERNRWAQAFNVPMATESPPNFPPRTLDVNRALCVLSQEARGQQLLVGALAKLWHEFWVNHADIASPEVHGAILADAVGDDTAEKIMANASTVGKEILRQNTDKAFGDGAFGVPWFLASNSSGVTEGFWGVDHIGQVLLFLGIEKAAHGGWNSVL